MSTSTQPTSPAQPAIPAGMEFANQGDSTRWRHQGGDELAWGRLRHWLLRTFFPVIVAKMKKTRKREKRIDLRFDPADTRNLKIFHRQPTCPSDSGHPPHRWREYLPFVRQITGQFARRMICWAKSGDVFSLGELFGMIKLGFSTESLVPEDPSLTLNAEIGHAIMARNTVLARHE